MKRSTTAPTVPTNRRPQKLGFGVAPIKPKSQLPKAPPTIPTMMLNKRPMPLPMMRLAMKPANAPIMIDTIIPHIMFKFLGFMIY